MNEVLPTPDVLEPQQEVEGEGAVGGENEAAAGGELIEAIEEVGKDESGDELDLLAVELAKVLRKFIKK